MLGCCVGGYGDHEALLILRSTPTLAGDGFSAQVGGGDLDEVGHLAHEFGGGKQVLATAIALIATYNVRNGSLAAATTKARAMPVAAGLASESARPARPAQGASTI